MDEYIHMHLQPTRDLDSMGLQWDRLLVTHFATRWSHVNTFQVGGLLGEETICNDLRKSTLPVGNATFYLNVLVSRHWKT